MASSTEPFLAEALAAITEDALFALSSSSRVDVEALRALAKRRAGLYEQAARGASRIGITASSAWVQELCALIAPIHPPDWMPMAGVIAAGVSLQGGARGVRALFTSKPSEREVERVSRLGAFAVRALSAVLGSDGPLSNEERDLREALVASLGLPEEQKRLLLAEPPMPIEALDGPEDVEGKLVRGFVGGAWLAAARDGLDPREEEAVLSLAQRLRSVAAETETLRSDARASIESRQAIGTAAIDAIRFMLADAPGESLPLARGLIPLLLPPIHAAEPLSALEQNAPVTLARRHELGRDGKALVLSLAWMAALHGNPTLTRRAELVARHETIAADLVAVDGGGTVREELEAFVEGELRGSRGASS